MPAKVSASSIVFASTRRLLFLAIVGVTAACSSVTSHAATSATTAPTNTLAARGRLATRSRSTATNTPRPEGSIDLPSTEAANTPENREGCGGGVLDGVFWSKATGIVLSRLTGADNPFPAEHAPTRMYVDFCDSAATAIVRGFNSSAHALPRAVIIKSENQRFDMTGAYAESVKGNSVTLRFHSITVQPPHGPVDLTPNSNP